MIITDSCVLCRKNVIRVSVAVYGAESTRGEGERGLTAKENIGRYNFMLNFIGKRCKRSLWPGNIHFAHIAIRMERKLKGLKRDNDTAIRR